MTSPHRASLRHKPKLLVVDDEPDNLDLLYRTFHREFKVLRAESGPVALDILSDEPDIAVIISDQRMPSMSGTEFLSLTATQYPDIIRIILTGYTDVEDLVDAINSGKVFRYVTKPWDDSELRAVVQQAVDIHNVLKARTQDLRRSLRQETLLNTINSSLQGALSSQQILQTIVETMGHMFEVTCCLLRQVQNGRLDPDCFMHWRSPQEPLPIPTQEQLAQTVWITREVQVIHDGQTLMAAPGAVVENTSGRSIVPGELSIPAESHAPYQAMNICSSLVVPLIYQQELVAVLGMHQILGPRAWGEEEIELVTMVANQAALALSQARTYEQMQALARREALVNTITTAIRSSLDPEEIFAAITQQLGEALHVDGCALSLWTAQDDYVQCVGLYNSGQQRPTADHLNPVAKAATWTSPYVDPQQTHTLASQAILTGSTPQADAPSLEDGQPHRPLPKSATPIEGNPVLKLLLDTKEPVVVNDLACHPELNVLDVPLRLPARALLVVPLLSSEGDIMGSISLRHTREARQWQTDDVELAQAVAAQAAIAVQQSRLYQTTRQQADQLMALDRQKTEFFQNISHEFRTPLTLNIGPLEAAVAQGEGLSYDQSVIALRNSRRLLRLVNQLLDLQRLDAGRMQPLFRPSDITSLIEQIVESFQPYCDRKQITLQANLATVPPIYLDPEKFDKVMYNLLSNAMKFTPAGGTIHLSLEQVGDRCQLQVCDTGVGIQTEQLPHLFERFRQADGSANRGYEGSGLGLALVQELVNLHGGEVRVESVYGEGTCFTVSLQLGRSHLPADQVSDVAAEIESSRAAVELADVELESQSDPAPVFPAVVLPNSAMADGAADGACLPADTSDRGDRRILVVDDNPDLRNYVTAVLQKAGYQVATARNGLEGLQQVQAFAPQLILTDLMMPQLSGLELIEQLRQGEETKGIPIILLTAKADEETRIEGTERGADAYLSKPFNHRELLAEVRNLLALKENERRVAELNAYLTESVLQRFLPPALVEKAARGELALDLRPDPKLVTIVFSDIVGFTQLSNTLRSRRVAELLNEYLTEMTHAIFDNGGTVDKFMGDAILAIFGAPEEISPNEQVRRAIAAAQQMNRTLAVLNQKWEAQGIGKVEFRCGIHQGTAVVGIFGGPERSDYTAIGPSVNIAARIQEAAEPGQILVSAAVADYLDDTILHKCSPLKLKGVDETVLTFSIKSDN
ncbi:MAG: response regulator [Synechococcales bacterium]|nr:response regulator [Synechococcales bacterium]